MADFYNLKIEECWRRLKSSPAGLGAGEVKKKAKKYGANKLPEEKPAGFLFNFSSQFKSPLIYTLIAAAGIVFLLGEITDGLIIFFVLFFNAIVGAIQEGKAQNTLAALKKFSETNAVVLREGAEIIIPDSEVVPGDVIILREGEKVPADARIISSHTLKAGEAALTGESKSVHKTAEPLEAGVNLPPMEQKNMVFKGTHIMSGNGVAVVTATGINTVIGKISKEIAKIETEIPLKRSIRYLSRLIIITVAGINSFLFLFGIIYGKSVVEMFTTLVSLSVSIIPEGLPIVMTLVLASGVWRMSRHNVLVKKLQAVEALGQARVIAVDKTGTLTKNEIVIEEAYFDGKFYDISGSGYEPKGEIRHEGKIAGLKNNAAMELAGKIAALCSNANIAFLQESQSWRVTGDPTEAALAVFAEKIGLKKNELLKVYPLLEEIPFNYKTKFHAAVHAAPKNKILVLAGAPEVVINRCGEIWSESGIRKLSDNEKAELNSIFSAMSAKGMRVLAAAFADGVAGNVKAKDIKPLAFVGFYGMRDALRPETRQAVAKAKAAGIKIVMITGDHRITAEAIGRDAGIYHDGDKILTGEEVEMLSEEALARELDKAKIFARVTPQHKLKIINAYKKRGDIVAMTGDGVNDAPSLIAADLGVAMGKIGTEVAKEAADIVLLDDNLGNIIAAVEEGRHIYKTIKKVILYLFSTSIGEVLAISLSIFLGLPLPLLAAQIIWLNLVTDGFLDMALAMEPKEKGLLAGGFKRPTKYIVDSLMAQRMVFMALPMALGTIFLFKNYFSADIVKAWTISLTFLAVAQWFNAWNCRSEDKSILQMNFLSNKFLVAATAIVIGLQAAAVYAPWMQKLLHTTSLNLKDWLLIVSVASAIILIEEARKFVYRRLRLA